VERPFETRVEEEFVVAEIVVGHVAQFTDETKSVRKRMFGGEPQHPFVGLSSRQL
jgi:hypothetical protein